MDTGPAVQVRLVILVMFGLKIIGLFGISFKNHAQVLEKGKKSFFGISFKHHAQEVEKGKKGLGKSSSSIYT